jgi:hypothetical protein
MTTFDKREQAFENKYAHDSEIQFRAEARRNRLLGQWAAARLGKSGAEVQAYADEIVKTHIDAATSEVLRRIRADFDAAGVAQSDRQIQKRMDEFLAAAIASLKSGS